MTLRGLRLKNRMSQKELALATGLTQGYISALERSTKKNPGQVVIKKLAAALNVSTGIILGLFPDSLSHFE